MGSWIPFSGPGLRTKPAPPTRGKQRAPRGPRGRVADVQLPQAQPQGSPPPARTAPRPPPALTMLCHRRSRSHLRGGAGGRLSRFLCHFPWQVENAPSVLTEVQAPLAPYPQLLSSRGSEDKPGVHSRSPGRGWRDARGGDEGVLGAAGGARWAPGVLAAAPPHPPRSGS